MSTEEQIEARRQEIRQTFLDNLRSIGISDEEAIKTADQLEKAVVAAVDVLAKQINEKAKKGDS